MTDAALIARLREWASREAKSGADMAWVAVERDRALTRSQCLLWVAAYLEGKK